MQAKSKMKSTVTKVTLQDSSEVCVHASVLGNIAHKPLRNKAKFSFKFQNVEEHEAKMYQLGD